MLPSARMMWSYGREWAIYWSKMESVIGIQSGEIGTATVNNNPHDFVPVKFNNGAYVKGSSLGYPGFESNTYYYSKFIPSIEYPSKGTVSFWGKVNWYNYFYDIFAGSGCFFGGERTQGVVDDSQVTTAGTCDGWGVGLVTYYNSIERLVLLYGNTVKGYYDISKNTLYHIYIVWDSSKGLDGGKSIRVFLDGTERISTTDDVPTITDPRFTIECGRSDFGGYDHYGYSWMDNAKLWSDVFEDPSLEWNDGDGREGL